MAFKNQLKTRKKEVLADAEKLGSYEAMWKWRIGSIITWHKLLEDWGRPDLKYKVVINTESPLDGIKVTSGDNLFIIDNYIDFLKTTITGLDRFKRYVSRLELEAREKDEEIKRLRGNGQIQWVKT
jgi:hypothetical protein